MGWLNQHDSVRIEGSGFESPQLHLWDLVSDQVRSSFLKLQPIQ
jgi:hypothetical protein